LVKAQTEKKSHGGYREGSGRKPIFPGGVLRRIFAISAHHESLLLGVQAYRGYETKSDAVRKLIEEAAEADAKKKDADAKRAEKKASAKQQP